MSFLKFWGSSKTSSSKSKKEKENSQPKNKDMWSELTPEEQAELQKLPFSEKKGRNLSISKSGRHKYKSKQRGALGDNDDLYSSHQAVKPTTHQQPSTSTASSSSHMRTGSYGNQGSLGRSSGGQCAVEESTKRYPSQQTKMARQPTAVW